MTTTPSSGRGRSGREDVRLMRGGRCHGGLPRRLLLGPDGAAAGRVRLGVAGHGDRPRCTGRASPLNLGTPTVVPPAWFYRAHPDAAARDARGRAPRLRLTRRDLPLQRRLPRARAARRSHARWPSATATHPAVILWHVHNEYGAPVLACYCDVCAARFPRGG
ncbi:beta-galactosidase [Streptomyces sp. L7]